MDQAPIIPFRARWGRLLSAADAAEYLGISPTTLKTLDIQAKSIGRRVVWDRVDLDRFVDRMTDQPIPAAEQGKEQDDEEARFFERRRARGRN